MVMFTRIDKVGMPHVIEFIAGKLFPYDTGGLDWIKLLPLNQATLLHGECTFPGATPERGKPYGYRIRASVNVVMAPPYAYEHWGRVPSTSHARGWVSGGQTFLFDDLEECAVHTLSHECFHFLSDSKPTGACLIRAVSCGFFNWVPGRRLNLRRIDLGFGSRSATQALIRDRSAIDVSTSMGNTHRFNQGARASMIQPITSVASRCPHTPT
jgi:hypothetical protein